MAQHIIPWNTGDGNIILTFTGQGNETVTVTSDENNLRTARSQTIVFKTTLGGVVTREVTVNQAAKPSNFRLSDGTFFKTSDGKYFNVRED